MRGSPGAGRHLNSVTKQDRNTGVRNEIARYVFMYEGLTEKLNRA